MIKLLLENGAYVDMPENAGWSALMIASQNDHTAVVKLLLENGAYIDMRQNAGWSALAIASENGYSEVVKLLIEKGAQVNMQSNNGLSSLYVASQNGHTEVIKLLLEKGAQVNGGVILGMSTLTAAVQGQHSESARLLLQYGAHIECNSRGSPLLELATNYDITKVNQRDNKGKTALMYASSNGNPDTVSQLLEKGAQIDVQDNKGWFPLMYAAQVGDLEICGLLVAYGANIHLTNYEGDTIFDVCSHEVLTFSFFQHLVCFLRIDVACVFPSIFFIYKTLYSYRLYWMKNTVIFVSNLHIFTLFLIYELILIPGINSYYPGVYFFQMPITEHITSRETSIRRLEEVGISVFIPEEEFLDPSIHPCFSGPFELPDSYESASPTYLITLSRRVTSSKDVTVRMYHYACLKSEKDCKDMVFFSASSTPVYRESNRPVYIFRKIQGAKGIFKNRRPGGRNITETLLLHKDWQEEKRRRGR